MFSKIKSIIASLFVEPVSTEFEEFAKATAAEGEPHDVTWDRYCDFKRRYNYLISRGEYSAATWLRKTYNI